jgi:hypothetical protein
MCRDKNELHFHFGFIHVKVKGNDAIRAVRWPITAFLAVLTVLFFIL